MPASSAPPMDLRRCFSGALITRCVDVICFLCCVCCKLCVRCLCCVCFVYCACVLVQRPMVLRLPVLDGLITRSPANAFGCCCAKAAPHCPCKPTHNRAPLFHRTWRCAGSKKLSSSSGVAAADTTNAAHTVSSLVTQTAHTGHGAAQAAEGARADLARQRQLGACLGPFHTQLLHWKLCEPWVI